MDKALNTFLDFDEHAKIRDRTHCATNLCVKRVTLRDRVPRVGRSLFDAEADTLLFDLDSKDNCFDFIALLIKLRRMPYFFGPRQIGDMDQAVDTRFNFNKYAEVGQ